MPSKSHILIDSFDPIYAWETLLESNVAIAPSEFGVEYVF